MEYRHLFEPIQVGPVTLKNRIVSAPTQCTNATTEGAPTREHVAYFAWKARGGAAAITVGESSVDRDYAVTHGGQLFIDNDSKIPWLTKLAEGIKQYGAVASLEICHGGGLTNPELIGGKDPIGPSPLPHLPGGDRIREMSYEQMEQVKENFANAAFRLKRAGFDMCLVHAGHGWLLSSFLSPYLNLRKDRYGGSLENRARYPLEVLDAIRAKCGPEFGIELRVSGDELFPEGLHLPESIEFAKMAQEKVDMIQVSAGMFNVPWTAARMHPTIFHAQGCNVYLAEAIKQAVDIPVSCVGGITTPEMAEQILAEGKADVIAMGRALIADPELPKKVYFGKREEVRQCTRCLTCHGRVATFLPVLCAINPIIGRESEWMEFRREAPEKKKVLIIGGGPAGMQAALTASDRGHEVILAEKEGALGGNLHEAIKYPFKQELKPWFAWIQRELSKRPIDIRLGTEMTPELAKEIAPDAIFVAVGADPVMPAAWEGKTKQAGTIRPEDLEGKENIVIIGGGMIGCETAYDLAEQGKHVTLIEAKPEVAADFNVITKIQMLEQLKHDNIRILTACTVVDISDAEVKVRRTDWQEGGCRPAEENAPSDMGYEIIPADEVLCAIGYRPRSEQAKAYERIAPVFEVIGDCAKSGRIMEAVRDGFRAAIEL